MGNKAVVEYDFNDIYLQICVFLKKNGSLMTLCGDKDLG